MDIRIPLPINSNPGMVFPPRRFKTVHDVAHFAARLLDGILSHREMLDSGELPLERAASRERISRCAWRSTTACWAPVVGLVSSRTRSSCRRGSD